MTELVILAPLAATVVALLGFSVGSFLNVVAYRVPLGLSVVAPPSSCPGCGAEIRARTNCFEEAGTVEASGNLETEPSHHASSRTSLDGGSEANSKSPFSETFVHVCHCTDSTFVPATVIGSS